MSGFKIMEGVSFMSTSTGMPEFSAPTMSTLHLIVSPPTKSIPRSALMDPNDGNVQGERMVLGDGGKAN
jgi:hypothetical protein